MIISEKKDENTSDNEFDALDVVVKNYLNSVYGHGIDEKNEKYDEIKWAFYSGVAWYHRKIMRLEKEKLHKFFESINNGLTEFLNANGF